jgi:hypothetical protein
MPYGIAKATVWAGDVLNRPGRMARVLEALAAAGADLEFIVARQVSPNTSRIFVAPLRSVQQRRAAADVGLVPAARMHVLRIEGTNRAGIGAAITRRVADAGINLRGFSGAVIARKLVCYLAFETESDAGLATRVIRKSLARSA